ncbi:MAG: hypothetical protein ACOYU3_04285 [Bacillota bacterium]
MNSEVIKAVREAEDKAEELVKNARVRAKEISAEAHAKAEAAAAAVHAQARQKAQAMFEAARTEAQADVSRFMETNRLEGEALKENARKHLNEARDYIIGRIVK